MCCVVGSLPDFTLVFLPHLAKQKKTIHFPRRKTHGMTRRHVFFCDANMFGQLVPTNQRHEGSVKLWVSKWANKWWIRISRIFQFGCCLNPKGWCFSAPLIIHSAAIGRSRNRIVLIPPPYCSFAHHLVVKMSETIAHLLITICMAQTTINHHLGKNSYNYQTWMFRAF